MFNEHEIQIIDITNGITEKNKNYFCFKNETPKCLRDNKMPLQLSLIIGFFISSFFMKENSIYEIIMIFIIFILCIWYLYDARYVRYYQKAAKALIFSRNEKVLKYLTKILKSKRIYIEDMPLAYNVLKAKDMLLKNDLKAAEYLAENALKQITDCPEAVKIKEICKNERKILMSK